MSGGHGARAADKARWLTIGIIAASGFGPPAGISMTVEKTDGVDSPAGEAGAAPAGTDGRRTPHPATPHEIATTTSSVASMRVMTSSFAQ